MSIEIHIVIISVCVLGLWGGAVLVVDSASHIAKKLGLSELIIGLTIVAIATSAPEFAVTVGAALAGQNEISVGNVVGSNIFNLGIILGLVVLFTTLKTDKKLLFRDGGLLLGTGIILVIFFYDLELSLLEGILLVTTLVFYISYLFWNKTPIEEEVPAGEFKWYDPLLLILGAVIIVQSADYFRESSLVVARHFGLSEWFIGITIIAGGTSAPELATSMVAVIKGRHGISAGNLIGSDLFNLLGVLGVAAIFHPLQIAQQDYIELLLLPAALLITLIFFRTGWKLTRLEGIFLIVIALFRWSFGSLF